MIRQFAGAVVSAAGLLLFGALVGSLCERRWVERRKAGLGSQKRRAERHVSILLEATGRHALRWAVPSDAPAILTMIRQLAVFEKQLHEVAIDEDTVRCDLEEGHFECLLTFQGPVCVGLALFHTRWSTAKGLGIYLHDLVVSPATRGCGVGSAMLRAVAQVALLRKCHSLQWCAFDWNQRAIHFYDSVPGARRLGTTHGLANGNQGEDRFVNFGVVGRADLTKAINALQPKNCPTDSSSPC
jgi:GNAT superfamily N-acetyltransferase